MFFTRVCDSVNGGWGSASVHSEAEPPGPDPHPTPGEQTPAYGLRAAGTHPTGMHSCLTFVPSFPQHWHYRLKNDALDVTSTLLSRVK